MPKVKPEERQKAYILALINGPKTVRELDEWVSNRLVLKELITEPTRNRDIKALRKLGYEIKVTPQEDSNQPIYSLGNFELSFPLVQEDLCMLLELISLGYKMKLLKDEALINKAKEYSSVINTKQGNVKLDVFEKLTHLEHEDLRRIRLAINKRCAIESTYHKPSDGTKMKIKGYPREIMLQDKFLYLVVKSEAPHKWREYRLDRILPPSGSENILLHPKNKDPDPNDSKPKTYLKCRILPPLSNFFEPSIWGISHIKKEEDGSLICSGYVQKQRFRVLKDVLAFLPYIEVLEDADLAKEFKQIVKASYEKLISK